MTLTREQQRAIFAGGVKGKLTKFATEPHAGRIHGVGRRFTGVGIPDFDPLESGPPGSRRLTPQEQRNLARNLEFEAKVLAQSKFGNKVTPSQIKAVDVEERRRLNRLFYNSSKVSSQFGEL